MSAPTVATRRLREVCVAAATCLFIACLSPSGDGEREGSGAERMGPAAGAADPSASGAPPAEGSEAAAQLATLWVGIYCSAPAPEPRHFSVYVDGTLAQELDASCPPHVQPGVAAPNGGQFRVVVPTGVRVLRFQDDTGDYHSEHDVAVPGDHWVFVHHRVLPDETGHLTSIIDRFDRPRYAY